MGFGKWLCASEKNHTHEEIVKYHYNRGGELHAMTSSKPNASGNIVAQKDIISQLGYDKFGQRTYLRYGNGTETTYKYEDANEKRRRLVNMQVRQLGTTASGAGALVTPRTFVNNKYTYDALSNVKSIHNNSVALPTDTQIGGRSIQNYTYDDLNRLETATGTFLGRNDQTLNPGAINYASQNYDLTMSYDNQHNIVAKNQLHRKATTNGSGVVQGAWSKVEKSSYGLVYEDYNTAGFTGDKAVQFEGGSYEYNQPHAPRKIVDQPDSSTPNCCDAANDPRVKIKTYDYDANGNQTSVSQTTCNTPNATVLRKNLWDEENRLRAIDLNPEATNVHPIAIYTYDAGGERIIKHNSTNVAIYENALKVGEKNQTDFMLYPSGMLVARPAADGSGGITYTKHYFAGTQRVSSKIGTTTNLGKFLEEWQQQEQSSPSYPAITTQAQMDNAKNAADKVYTAFGITPAPTFEGNTSLVAIPAFEHGGNEHDHYFFHPDHLGSSNYITNFVGEVTQHSEYFAFGETFIEEHKNSHNSPYKFNGKELDEESGLYYYGARYYDPRISIWASVDPLVEQTMSAYGYCYQNPIILVDQDGAIPILPLLIKFGVGATVDMMSQMAISYLFDPTVNNFGQAFDKVSWSQVGIVGATSALPWNVPGGKWGKAGFAATTDVLTNALNTEDYSLDQAGKDFVLSFVTQIAGGELSDYISKYGTKKIAKVLSKLGLDDEMIEKVLTGKGTTWNGPVDYSELDLTDKMAKTRGKGKNFTTNQKDKVKDLNKNKNNGKLRDDSNGDFLKEGKKGGNDPKQAEVDHKIAKKAKVGPKGTNKFENAQVLGKKNNGGKSNN